MLVLARKRGERVIVELPGGLRIEVQVVGMRGDTARIAFAAPPEVEIWREELGGPCRLRRRREAVA